MKEICWLQPDWRDVGAKSYAIAVMEEKGEKSPECLCWSVENEHRIFAVGTNACPVHGIR